MKPTSRCRGFTLIELMIVVAIIGILASVAIPQFLKFQARSKAGECLAGLKGIYTAERSYFAEHDTYGDSFDAIGFLPERGNRYTYWLGQGTGQVPQDRSGATLDTSLSGIDVIRTDMFRFTGLAMMGGNVATDGQQPMATTAAVQFTADPGHTVLTTTASTNLAQVVTGGAGDFAASCAGNIDNEGNGIDARFISSQSATITSPATGCIDPSATNISAGTPGTVYDDILCDN